MSRLTITLYAQCERCRAYSRHQVQVQPEPLDWPALKLGTGQPVQHSTCCLQPAIIRTTARRFAVPPT